MMHSQQTIVSSRDAYTGMLQVSVTLNQIVAEPVVAPQTKEPRSLAYTPSDQEHELRSKLFA